MKLFKPGQCITLVPKTTPNVHIILRILKKNDKTNLFYVIATKMLIYVADDVLLSEVFHNRWQDRILPVKKIKIVFVGDKGIFVEH